MRHPLADLAEVVQLVEDMQLSELSLVEVVAAHRRGNLADVNCLQLTLDEIKSFGELFNSNLLIVTYVLELLNGSPHVLLLDQPVLHLLSQAVELGLPLADLF